MYLKEFTIKKKFERASKLNKVHTYFRNSKICVFRCDNCNAEFERPRGSIDPKRLSNNYFHVCENCDSKRFAQKKGVERKKVWNMNASSDTPIGKL
jgi:DNA-directed RNA polymerase subunit RPC12/RpoP